MAKELSLPSPRSKVALVAIAHADDLLLFCGATVLNLIANEWHVHVVRVTDDRWDSWGISTKETISKNFKEFTESMSQIGVASVIDFGYPTDVLGDKSEVSLREQFIDLIRELKPYLIMTFDPDSYLHEDNEDHKLVARAMSEASWTAGFDKHPGAHGKVYSPHLPIEKWYFGRNVAEVTHFQDLNPYVDQLLNAIGIHKTMLRNMVFQLHLQANFLGYSLDRLISLVEESPKEFAKMIIGDRNREELRVVDSGKLFRIMEKFGDAL
jgi:LmbE family N-acetylglucosaminyl deacetylase